MTGSLDASMFVHGSGFHAMHIHEAMSMLTIGYQSLLPKLKYKQDYNENRFRDDLIKNLPAKKEGVYITFDTESRDVDRENVRIDITIITLEVLTQSQDDFSKRITIECKIIGIDQYINRNGIVSFVEGKYASQLPVAGMIGFVLSGTCDAAISGINKKLKSHSKIKTVKLLEKYELETKFDHSYKSTHNRDRGLNNIDIYHLMLNYSNIVET